MDAAGVELEGYREVFLVELDSLTELTKISVSNAQVVGQLRFPGLVTIILC